MTESDLPGADELRRTMGWNQRPREWRYLLSFEPDGCFVAEENGPIIGTVTTTTYGHAMAWIGMMLVHPEHRRRGIGTALMRRALDYLKLRGVACIRLDATPAGKPVYEKLGFVDEWTLTRHRVGSARGKPCTGVRPYTESDWKQVEQIDATAFGVSRARILKRLSHESRCTLVIPAEGPVAGYGMLRPGSEAEYLGPLVCTNADAAVALASALLLHAEGRPVFWDVPDGNDIAMDLARRFSFAPVRPLTRMRLGPPVVPSNPAAQLAIADPSVG